MDKRYLDKCHHDSWNRFKIFLGAYLLVKIGPVTAEILLTLSLCGWVVVGGGGGVKSFSCLTQL